MIDRRFLLFLLAGCVNTLFGYAVYGGLVLLGLVPQIALAFSTIAGLLFNFFSTSAVFSSLDRRRLPRFLGVYAISFIANAWLLGLVIRAGLGPIVAQGLIMLLFAPLNFLAMRHFVFASQSEHRS